MKRLVHAVLRVGNNEGRELVLPAGLSCLVSGDLAIAFCAAAGAQTRGLRKDRG